jgi:hypothetical protein
MNRLLLWAARLYPRWWRTRYGDELEALLEESGPRFRDVWDIAKEALTMQARRFVVLATVGAVLGGLAGGLMSRARHRHMYVVPSLMAVSTPGTDDPAATAQAVNSLVQTAFTRDALANILSMSRVYEAERPHKTTDQLVQRLREDIRIAPVPSNPHQFTVAFAGASPHLAAEIGRKLVTRLVDSNVRDANLRPTPPLTLQAIETLPLSPNRPPVAASFLVTAWAAVGALVGLALAWLRRGAPAEAV